LLLSIGVSCKTTKNAAHKPALEAEQVSEHVTDELSAPIQSEPVKEAEEETPVIIRSEEVKLVEEKVEKEATFDFYIIIGSFSLADNADKYSLEMKDKGFQPIVLISETGLYRVAIDQNNSENDARAAIKQIRTQFPEHNDVWLLKKK
jgi:cell division protein FtsN